MQRFKIIGNDFPDQPEIDAFVIMDDPVACYTHGVMALFGRGSVDAVVPINGDFDTM